MVTKRTKARELVLQVKMLAVKAKDLRSILGTHIGKRGN